LIVNLPFKGHKGFVAIPVEKRVWTKVKKTESCWEWTASKNVHGYGIIKKDGRMHLAHRVLFELTGGKIPNGMQVLHHCDNPACVNPDHLFLGTHGDNMRDMFKKGRGNPGGYNLREDER